VRIINQSPAAVHHFDRHSLHAISSGFKVSDAGLIGSERPEGRASRCGRAAHICRTGAGKGASQPRIVRPILIIVIALWATPSG
jgi:hypothetical protein